MNLAYVMTKDGICLTQETLDECRSYAIAHVLANHHAEFERERIRLIAQRLELVKAQLSPNNSITGGR
jgi:hypothetical protein